MVIFSSAGFPPCALWDFAFKLYSEKPVEGACLSLQERCDIDVNLLLFGVWVAASGRERLTDEELQQGIAASARWQEKVVLRLRELRGYLKSPEEEIDTRLVGDLRRVIADSELYSERLELLMLGEIITRPAIGSFDGPDCSNAAAENLVAYFTAAQGEPSAADLADLQVIWQAAFPAAKIADSVLSGKQESLV